MRKQVLLLFLIFFVSVQASADSLSYQPRTNLSIDLLCNASLISLNYELVTRLNKNLTFTGKHGLGYNQEFQICYGTCPPSENILTIPYHFTLNFGKRIKYLEIGMGATYLEGFTVQPYIIYAVLGFRYLPLSPQKLSDGFFFQYPLSGLFTQDIIFVPIGINFGIIL